MVRMISAARPSTTTGCGPSTANGLSLVPAAMASRASSNGARTLTLMDCMISSCLVLPPPTGVDRSSTRGQPQGVRLPGTYAKFDTTEGTFTVRLFDAEAPATVANFVGLAEGTKAWKDPRTNQTVNTPYYNDVVFHRVIDGFMIQGGDPLGQGTGGPGFTFADE